MKDQDPNISQRKLDHINLAFESVVEKSKLDQRFSYEPMLAAHAKQGQKLAFKTGDKVLDYPIWISSMTGGTEKARKINKHLAQICKEFGLGMGLGSCRQLLESRDRFSEFDVRDHIGDQPLFANLGIAQLEQMIADGSIDKIDKLVSDLRADGIFIHVNPLQEWMQPEGDHIKNPPIETITAFLKDRPYHVIIKEVGQGMGKESLRALLKLPILAVELAANGGTNFSKLELLRADVMRKEAFKSIANLGHSAEQMITWTNEIYAEEKDQIKCQHLIISGGIKDFLDGYYLMSKSKMPAIYAQASAFLKYAIEDYEDLQAYASLQIQGLLMANSFLTIK